MSARRLRIGITTGEPAGIGPEIAARLLARLPDPDTDCDLILIGDGALLEAQLARHAPAVLVDAVPVGSFSSTHVSLWHVPLATLSAPGQLDARNGAYVLRTLDLALDACVAGDLDAMVTCPVAKSVINDAGIAFTGHTEYLAQRTATPKVVMMLAGGDMRVALATTHLPLAAVPAAVTFEGLSETLCILHADLRDKFGIAAPRIAVCGLNPHAGESGHMGREEIDVIIPVITSAQASGIDARGPYPADTVFQPHVLRNVDAVLAMYHDQGLPTLKYASFGHGINVTLGLPIIRTSVDHGTALDIAGQDRADPGSLIEALRVAVQMARARQVA